jgi:hypothetical protein
MSKFNLLEETLITLKEAAKDFGGVQIPFHTVQKYVYQGVRGLKLESISINGRYTSKEAIRRFIEQKQCLGQPEEKPKRRFTQAQTKEILQWHAIIKDFTT